MCEIELTFYTKSYMVRSNQLKIQIHGSMSAQQIAQHYVRAANIIRDRLKSDKEMIEVIIRYIRFNIMVDQIEV